MMQQNFCKYPEIAIRRDLNNGAGENRYLCSYLVDNAKQNYENNYFVRNIRIEMLLKKCVGKVSREVN